MDWLTAAPYILIPVLIAVNAVFAVRMRVDVQNEEEGD